MPPSYRWAAFGMPMVVLLIFNAWLAIRTSHQVFDQQEQLRFGLRVEARVNTVLSLAKDIETGTRGYLVSGDDLYLAPYQKAAVGLNEQLGALGRELDSFPHSAEAAAALYRSITALLDQAESAIDARNRLGDNPSVAQIEPLLAAQKARMDALRGNAERLREQQSEINIDLDRTLARTRHDAQIVILVPSVLSILLAGLLWSLIVRDFRRAEVLAHERDVLLDKERRARADAEAASRARDDFVATVSHELRTPLQSILGWTQVLQHRAAPAGDPSSSAALGSLERSARHLATMVDDLLDASRALSGRLVLHTEQVDLAEVVRATVELSRPAARAKRVELALDLGQAPMTVVGDAQRLRQIAINLIGNAVKFTPPGGRVQVSLHGVGPLLRLKVRDTGIGIAPELLPMVFQRFVQGGAATTRQHGGLGLGLAIVKHLVEMHGGQVTAASEGPGRGAEFVVSFPRHAAEPQPADDDEDERRGASPPALDGARLPARTPRLPGARLLIVDDDADVRAILGLLLREEGAVVATAASAAEALELLRRTPVDLVLSDVGMPDTDGYALARALRALRDGESATPPRTPMIALTAFSRAEDERRALDSGFDAHVGKPVDVERLVAVLRRHVGTDASRTGR